MDPQEACDACQIYFYLFIFALCGFKCRQFEVFFPRPHPHGGLGEVIKASAGTVTCSHPASAHEANPC